MVKDLKSAWEKSAEQFSVLEAVTDGKCSVTYEQLNGMANRVARLLLSREQEGSYIGLVMDHSLEMAASIIGILKAGFGYVPVEPEFPSERISYIMKETGVQTVLTQKKYRHYFEQGPEAIPVGAGFFSESGKEANPPLSVAPDSPAYVLYTSGSTGRPKGVVIAHENVCHYVRAFCGEFHPSPGDRMLQYSVCTFDIFVEEVFPILLSGGTLVIADYASRHDFSRLVHFIKENRVTMVSGFPYLFIDFNKLSVLPESLRLLISGGDVLRYEYVDRLLPRVEVYNTYGPSETTVCVSYFRCSGTKPLKDGTFPVGWEVPGITIKILDKNRRVLSDGEIGELGIIGDGVGKGYLCGKEETELHFVTVPETGQRMYLSGDLGYRREDGAVVFLKRKDEQVMIKGKRVEPHEVENVLCGCPHVEQAVVLPQTDERELSYLTAYFVADIPLRISGLKRDMGRYLPHYMIPEFFVQLAELPQGLSGKVDRNALPRVLKEG